MLETIFYVALTFYCIYSMGFMVGLYSNRFRNKLILTRGDKIGILLGIIFAPVLFPFVYGVVAGLK